jgi:hypothetical protein
MPTKTIAVPANPGARRGKRIAASTVIDHDDDGAVSLGPSALRKPPRPIAAQPAHRFHVGERLRMSNGGYSVARIGAFCKVVSLLPYEGHGSLLYRVRSDNEAHERIVAEADLARG